MQHDPIIVRRVAKLGAKFKFTNTGAIGGVRRDPITGEIEHMVKEPSKIRCDILYALNNQRFASAFGETEAEALKNAVAIAEQKGREKSAPELAAENEELKRRLRLMENPPGKPFNRRPKDIEDEPVMPDHDPGDEDPKAEGVGTWNEGLTKKDLRDLLKTNNISAPGNIGRGKLVEMCEEHGLHLPVATN